MIKPDRGSGGGIPASERGREGEGTCRGTRYYSSQGVSFPLSSCCFHLGRTPQGRGRAGEEGSQKGLGAAKCKY